MPNIRAARSVLPQFKPHTERSVLGGAKVVRCGAVCSGRARQMSLGPAPSLLVSSLGGCSHPPTSVQRIKSNPLTLAPGRSGSALPSSVPIQRHLAPNPYRSATRPLHFHVTHPSSPPHSPSRHHPCCSSLLQRLHTCISTSPAALGKGHGASDQASGVVVSLDRFMCDAPARPAPPGEFQPFLSAHPSTDARPPP